MKQPRIYTATCPPELDKRMIAGTEDVLSIFEAHSDYNNSLRVSVLASVLALVLMAYDDATAAHAMRTFNDAVALNREGLKKRMREEEM